MKHSFAEGKYTVIQETGIMHALRNGEHWRDLTGDNLIYWMLVEVDELKGKQHELMEEIAALRETK